MKYISTVCLAIISILLINPFIPKAEAIFYARKDTSYQQSGYIFMKLKNGKYAQCGINYISNNVGVTAAHCLDDAAEVYAGIGQYDENKRLDEYVVKSFSISPNYDLEEFEYYPGKNDVGVVTFSSNISVSNYGIVKSPKESCNYHIIGYGDNETDVDMERRGADVCIKNITDYSFELEFPDNSFFCNGDSGSGVYEKSSNSLVGTISAYYTPVGGSSCSDAVAFIVTRLDANISYLDDYIPKSGYDLNNDVDIETKPQDYFGNDYPETRNDDGGFNYNHEIEVQIEELENMFDDIYPENGTDSTNNDSTSSSYSTKSSGSNSEKNSNSNNPDDENSDNIGSIILGVICTCVCGSILIIALILIISKARKKKDTKPNITTADLDIENKTDKEKQSVNNNETTDTTAS